MNASSPTPVPASVVIQMDDVAVGSMRDPAEVVGRNIDWTVHAGDFWVIAGLQGTGKSDFLLMTGGVIAPAAGRYRLFREEMPIFEGERLRQRLRLGLVFDGGRLFSHLTVLENVSLPLCYHRNVSITAASPEVRSLLAEMELTPFADSTPGAIGRSWQKRVGLARALVLKPEVLLIDNPLEGLDLRQVAWWLGFLGKLSRGHPLVGGPVTLVVTTADLSPWRELARQYAILREQRLQILGSWQEVEHADQGLLRTVLP